MQASGSGDITHAIAIPFWVMLIGAVGISFGLVLFGPRMIRVVGTQITKLNPMRAYCVALSAAITVIVASWLGLPVSSTHIAVGAVFGVGFPPFLGGPFMYVDAVGAKEVVAKMERLQAIHGEQFAPPPLLLEHAASGKPFHSA